MSFIDMSVAAVPTDTKAEYLEHCRAMDSMFKEVGALSVVDTWGVDVPDGKLTDFKRAVQAEAHETVAVGWITWPDKATRDAGWATLMQDERMKAVTMPYDGKRMIFGGFETIHEV